MKLNFHSQRAKFKNLLLRSEDNILRADIAKKDVEDTFYSQGTFFTTCNLPHPHYGFYVERLKYRNQKKFVADKIYPVFNGVKIPVNIYNFVFLFPKSKHSGFLFPHFGENQNGFYAQDLGYYFYFNDYIDLAIKTSLYSRGSFSVKGESNYIYRYHYKGNIFYEISKNNKYVDSFNSGNVKAEQDYVFKWQHESLDSKLRKFSINIDLHGVSPKDSMLTKDNDSKGQQTSHSTIRYSRQELFNRLYTLDATVQGDKNFKTNVTNLTLPLLTLSSVPLHIFRFGRKTSKYFWDDIEAKHTAEFTWKTTTERKAEDSGIVEDPYAATKKKEKKNKEKGFKFSWENRKLILKNAHCGAKHTLPIETNFKIFKYFNLRPFVNLTLRNYFTRRDYSQNGSFEEKHGLYNVWDYNGGAELKTTIYGNLHFNPNGKISAVRHKIDPSVSFTYTPDLSSDIFGFYQNFNGTKYNRFVGAIYGNASDHRSAIISTKWENILEMKLNEKGEKKTVSLIESFSFGTGYDLLAPRFGMQDINFSAATSIGIVKVKYDATIDPYFHDFVEGGKKERINDFAWNHNQYLGTITKSSFSISTTLQSESMDKMDKKIEKYKEMKRKHERGEQIEQENEDEQGENDLEEDLTSEDYAPLYFLKNWKVNLEFRRDFSFDIDKEKIKEKHIFNISTDLQLTKTWKFNTSLVFDFDKEKFKYKNTRFGIAGDLHCWVLTFSMVPFGKEISYDFSLGIKSSMLSEIKIPHRAKYKSM